MDKLSILPLHITISCPFNLIEQIYNILTPNEHAKYDFDKLIERFLYAAPEMQARVFFHGYSNNGIVSILNKYCAEKNDTNIQIHALYINFVKAYQANRGFIYTNLESK
tara:strand:+ start:2892 stop:3218 length:327 start_codon:yes stop_codon:yes gene_type:complete